MAKSNIIYRSYRLNLDNEQHRRVNKVLAELNSDIHKSVNQFITDAVDFYVGSLGDADMLRQISEQNRTEYISKTDLVGIREELRNDVKNEIIMLLGAALGGGMVRAAEGITDRGRMDIAATKAADRGKGQDDPTMMELVDSWG